MHRLYIYIYIFVYILSVRYIAGSAFGPFDKEDRISFRQSAQLEFESLESLESLGLLHSRGWTTMRS